jgi:hypothetical protein
MFSNKQQSHLLAYWIDYSPFDRLSIDSSFYIAVNILRIEGEIEK